MKKFLHRYLPLSLSVVLLVTAGFFWTQYKTQAGFGNGYSYRKVINFSCAKISATQTNFPVLISGTYSYLATSANGGKVQNTVAQSGGGSTLTVPADAIFTSDFAGNSTIPFEWETYASTTGASNVWIQVPTLACGVPIYLFYGNTSVSTYQGNVNGTWDSNFKGVYHLPDGTTLSAKDSTSNAANGTVNGPTATTGKIDGAASFNSNNIAPPNATFDWQSNFTISAWFNMSSMNTDDNTILGNSPDGTHYNLFSFSHQNSDHLLYDSFNGTQSANVIGTATLTTGVWYYATIVKNSGTYTLYLNGASDNSSSGQSNGPSTNELIGSLGPTYTTLYYMLGTIDEMEISQSVRSASWIQTEYNNQFSPSTFYTIQPDSMFTFMNASFTLKNANYILKGN